MVQRRASRAHMYVYMYIQQGEEKIDITNTLLW
jgi:hypothetical protein